MGNPYLNVMKLNRFLLISEAPSSSPPNINSFPETILAKLREWLCAIPNLIFSVLDKLKDPETWEAAKPYLIAGAAILLAILFLCCCLRLILGCLTWVLRALWSLMTTLWRLMIAVFCCCGSSEVIMRAPGMAGRFMARATFEAAPKLYFSSFRAGTLAATHGLG